MSVSDMLDALVPDLAEPVVVGEAEQHELDREHGDPSGSR